MHLVLFQPPVQEFPLVIFFFFSQGSNCQTVKGETKPITLLSKPHPPLQERQEEPPSWPAAASFGRPLRRGEIFHVPELGRVFFGRAMQTFVSVAEFSEQFAELECKGGGNARGIAADSSRCHPAEKGVRSIHHFVPLPEHTCPKTVTILSVAKDDLAGTASLSRAIPPFRNRRMS